MAGMGRGSWMVFRTTQPEGGQMGGRVGDFTFIYYREL